MWIIAWIGEYWMPAFAGMTLRLTPRCADFIEQLEPVLAQLLVLDIDRDFIEESIDVRAKLRHRKHGGFEVLACDSGGGFRLGSFDRARQGTLLALAIEGRIRPTDVLAGVALLLDADDIGGALVAGEQILAVFGIEEFSQRLHASDNEEKIILPLEGKDRINKIVAGTLLAQLNLEAIGEKREEFRN